MPKYFAEAAHLVCSSGRACLNLRMAVVAFSVAMISGCVLSTGSSIVEIISDYSKRGEVIILPRNVSGPNILYKTSRNEVERIGHLDFSSKGKKAPLLTGTTEAELDKQLRRALESIGFILTGDVDGAATDSRAKEDMRLLLLDTTEVDVALELLDDHCHPTAAAAVFVAVHAQSGRQKSIEFVVSPISIFANPRAATAYTQVKAAFRDCKTGDLLWRNTIMYRAPLSAEDGNIPRSLAVLFSNLRSENRI